MEVLSPDDTPAEIRQKVEEYLARGTAIVLAIDPGGKAVSIFRPHAERTLSADDELNLDDIVPGFRCRVGEIFE